MSPKIIFFDIDDTLYVRDEQRIPHTACYALQRLHEQGITVAIATGRSVSILPDPVLALIEEVPIDVLVSINGQYVQHRGQKCVDFPMDTCTVGRVVQTLEGLDMNYAFVSHQRISVAKDEPRVLRALEAFHLPYTIDSNHHQHDVVYQMMAFYDVRCDIRVQAQLPENVKTVRWHDEMGVDILEKNASKARGIAAVVQALGFNMDETMAFGDGLNDIEMLQAVGFGVAMGNGAPQLRSIADHVCPSAAQDGIYRALLDLGVLRGG